MTIILSRQIFGLPVILTGQVPCKWNGMILFKLYVLSTLFVQEELYFCLLAIMSKAPGLNDYCVVPENRLGGGGGMDIFWNHTLYYF